MAPSKLTISSTLTMNNGVKIPRLIFGVYESLPNVCVTSCSNAFKAGYLGIDSAQYYRNEKEVGIAADQSGIDRKELFLTTKQISPSSSGVDATYDSIKNSVQLTGGSSGYVDLFLIHSAGIGADGRKTLWLALEKAYNEGLCKSIGVSNWGIGHIEEMKGYATIFPPHVNQIELHPWCQQREIVDYCKKNNIVVEAYCPVVRNHKGNDPTLKRIAEKHSKTTNQVLLRWSLQKDLVPLPKSDNPDRIKGNADLYDFELDAEDMKTLDDLDEGDAGAIVEFVVNS